MRQLLKEWFCWWRHLGHDPVLIPDYYCSIDDVHECRRCKKTWQE